MRSRVRRPSSLPTMEQVAAERKRLKHRRAYGKALRSTIYVLIVVAAVSILAATLFFPVLQISGTSMEPTLNNNDIIVLVKTSRYQPGDLCSFTWNNRTLIKRVIAVPGNWISIDEAGNVTVDGVVLDEPYLIDKSLGECDITFPYQVPDGCYFLMGDHRSTSIDSRNTLIGSINKEQMIGKVLFRVWPIIRKE